jgi:hypothetical protein
MRWTRERAVERALGLPGGEAGQRAVQREQLGAAGQEAVAVAQGLVERDGEDEASGQPLGRRACRRCRRAWRAGPVGAAGEGGEEEAEGGELGEAGEQVGGLELAGGVGGLALAVDEDGADAAGGAAGVLGEDEAAGEDEEEAEAAGEAGGVRVEQVLEGGGADDGGGHGEGHGGGRSAATRR